MFLVAALAHAAPLVTPTQCDAAKDYNAAHAGVSLVVLVSGVEVCADFPNGGSREAPHELASGTKSFTGLLAVALAGRGVLTFDERVADTLVEWQSDPRKSAMTIRQLLGLVSGLDAAPLGRETYASALAAEAFAEPGATFRYGSAPFQAFGEWVRRKTGEDPVAVLRRLVLDPIGCEPATWRKGADGYPLLPAGAWLSAPEWALVGELVRQRGRWGTEQVLDPALLDELFVPSPAAPWYGVSWWLLRAVPAADRPADLRPLRHVPTAVPDWLPHDVVMAAGAGDQRLYVSREADVVVVRQAGGILAALAGRESGWSDVGFLATLLEPGRAVGADPPKTGEGP